MSFVVTNGSLFLYTSGKPSMTSSLVNFPTDTSQLYYPTHTLMLQCQCATHSPVPHATSLVALSPLTLL